MALRIGIVGTGGVAQRNYIPFLAQQPDVSLGYFNRTAAKADAAAAEHGGQVFPSIEALMAWGPDTVFVLTRETDRYEAISALLDHDPRRLFFEKPLVARQGQAHVSEQDFFDARELMRRVAAQGCQTAMIFNYRFFDQSLAAKRLIAENDPQSDVFVRATVHVDASIPGTRVRGCSVKVSMFVYDAVPIVPQDGMRLKTSVWRRIPDNAIPSRAKVNGAYVNSVLAKQDAIDSGYDDCIFLDVNGHVCELSAANIFVVRGDTLITPDVSFDILDSINRRTLLTLAEEDGIRVVERAVDLTELYIADEVFVTGTSAGVAPVTEVDGRLVSGGTHGPISTALRKRHTAALRTDDVHGWVTTLS